jgi:hypothetical protein
MSVASLVDGKVAMGTLSRVVYCLLLQTAYDWPKALNARLRKKYEKNLKAYDEHFSSEAPNRCYSTPLHDNSKSRRRRAEPDPDWPRIQVSSP